MIKKIKTTEPLMQQAYRLLKNDLIDARFVPGENLPSLRTMIQMYGFKRDTLWRAIKQLESENWLKSSTSLRFCVSPEVANSLLSKLSIVFVTLGYDCIMHHLFQRIYDTLVAHGPRMNIYPTLQLVNAHSHIEKIEELAKTDLILLSSDLTKCLPIIQRFGHPLIGINTSKSLNLPYAIDIDNFLGGQMACPPLLASDPQQVLIITTDSQDQGPSESLALRTLGFRKAWVESGRSIHRILELAVSPSSGWAGIHNQIHAFIIKHPQVQGVFATTDGFAVHTFDILTQLGRKIPSDVQLIGFDGNAEALRHDPPITTVAQLVETCALKTLQLTRRLVQNDPQAQPPEPTRMEIKPKLIQGHTTLPLESTL